MLTVADVLKFDILQGARVVAGAAGLDRPVRWVHVVDEPDATEWVRGGEIVLTTGRSIASDPALQKTIVSDLADKDLAGLFIATGRYLHRIPEVMVEASETHALPLVELPWELPFVDVMQGVLERVVGERCDVLHQASAIHKALAETILAGGGLTEIAQRLAEITDCAVSIESPSFRLLARAGLDNLNSEHPATLATGSLSAGLIQVITANEVISTAISERRPIHVSPAADQEIALDRILAPIFVADELSGYLWLIAAGKKLGELEMLAAEHAATVAGLAMRRERDLHEAEKRLHGNLLARLLGGHSDGPADWLSLADRIQLDTSSSYRVMVADLPAPEHAVEANKLMRRVEDCADLLGPHVFAGWLGNCLVLIFEITSGKDLSRSLAHMLASEWSGLSIGIGGTRNQMSDLRQSYEEALEALDIARSDPESNTVCIDDLGFLHWLYHVPREHRDQNVYVQKLAGLIAYDQDNQADLTNTLEIYLDTNGNAALASQNLFVHRNTLFYRLRRIEEICEVDLSNPLERLNLHVALKGYRLFGSEPGEL